LKGTPSFKFQIIPFHKRSKNHTLGKTLVGSHRRLFFFFFSIRFQIQTWKAPIRCQICPRHIALTHKALILFCFFLKKPNYLGGGLMIRVWDQEICSFSGLRFEPCGCSYDGHWRLTWSLISGPVGLVEMHVSWSGHPR
jgi:hypothetical protein